MALITISGYPSSGKSKRAHQLASYFQTKIKEPNYSGPTRVTIIDDESNHVPRSVYDLALTEKSGRANLYAAVIRSLSPDTITICDSLNYIKGFRYQMYCAAREAGLRVCTVHVATPPDKCREWHQANNNQYDPETFSNLITRYEEPSSMVRWDKPLYTIAWDEDPPFEAIWSTITSGHKAPPNAAVAVAPRPPPNTLQTLSRTTSQIVSSLMTYLETSPAGTFPISSVPGLVLHLPPRKITLSEMQRLKRQYESVQTTAQRSGGLAAGAFGEVQVATGFTRFLESAWEV